MWLRPAEKRLSDLSYFTNFEGGKKRRGREVGGWAVEQNYTALSSAITQGKAMGYAPNGEASSPGMAVLFFFFFCIRQNTTRVITGHCALVREGERWRVVVLKNSASHSAL